MHQIARGTRALVKTWGGACAETEAQCSELKDLIIENEAKVRSRFWVNRDMIV